MIKIRAMEMIQEGTNMVKAVVGANWGDEEKARSPICWGKKLILS